MIVRLNFKLECAEELVSKIPAKYFKSTDTKFYDPAMAGGQFIAAIISRLRECGHSDKNITNRVFGTEVNELHLNFGIRNHNLIGNFSTKEYNMKFDVIVGNPPYQAATDSKARRIHSVWPDFVELGMNLLSPNGCLAFVTPNISLRKKLLEMFHKNDVLFYNGETVKKHFIGIGSTFCSWIIRKSKTDCQSIIVSEGKEIQMKFPDEFSFIPLSFKREDLNFLRKMMNQKNKLKFETCGVGYHTQRKELYSDTKTKIFKYPCKYSNRLKYCKYEHPINKEKKVICSAFLGLLRPEYDNGQLGITQNSTVMLVKSKAEGMKIVKFLNSESVNKFISLIGNPFTIDTSKILDILTYD